MDAQYLESYNKLSDLHPGQLAASKDRKSLYLCVWVPALHGAKDSYKAIIDLTNPTDQYVYNINMDQPVKILSTGDKFVITV
jgi:hypothetical protein